jgi:hypothetical protein
MSRTLRDATDKVWPIADSRQGALLQSGRGEELTALREDQYVAELETALGIENGNEIWNSGWIDVTQNKAKWRAVVNTVMNLLVPFYEGNFLPSRNTISFSRRVLLYGVSFIRVLNPWNNEVYVNNI